MTTLWEGSPATTDQLEFLGRSNYGNFTVLQVRRQSARGLALHVQRLRDNAGELFGAAPTEDRLRTLLTQAVAQHDCSVRVTIVSRDVDGLLAGEIVEPEVVITTSEARQSSTVPITVRTVSYQRETPWVKHRATHGLIRHTRAARQAGFDDALFLDAQGHVSEGTTWNALFRAAGAWVWPEADVLRGVTLQLLRRAMDEGGVKHETRPVSLADLKHHQAGFALNATSATRPVQAVDGRRFTEGKVAAAELAELWASIAAEPL